MRVARILGEGEAFCQLIAQHKDKASTAAALIPLTLSVPIHGLHPRIFEVDFWMYCSNVNKEVFMTSIKRFYHLPQGHYFLLGPRGTGKSASRSSCIPGALP